MRRRSSLCRWLLLWNVNYNFRLAFICKTPFSKNEEGKWMNKRINRINQSRINRWLIHSFIQFLFTVLSFRLRFFPFGWKGLGKYRRFARFLLEHYFFCGIIFSGIFSFPWKKRKKGELQKDLITIITTANSVVKLPVG